MKSRRFSPISRIFGQKGTFSVTILSIRNRPLMTAQCTHLFPCTLAPCPPVTLILSLLVHSFPARFQVEMQGLSNPIHGCSSSMSNPCTYPKATYLSSTRRSNSCLYDIDIRKCLILLYIAEGYLKSYMC
jgi:hypothetical protein